MQIGVMALGLAARLHREESSFAAFYCDRLERYDIRHRFYERQDVTLFDESLRGDEREAARNAGNERKEATVAWFAGLEDLPPADVHARLCAGLPEIVRVPNVERCFHAGDGTLIEFEGCWFELRASGTDAVLRYYMEGLDADAVHDLNTALVGLDITV